MIDWNELHRNARDGHLVLHLGSGASSFRTKDMTRDPIWAPVIQALVDLGHVVEENARHIRGFAAAHGLPLDHVSLKPQVQRDPLSLALEAVHDLLVKLNVTYARLLWDAQKGVLRQPLSAARHFELRSVREGHEDPLSHEALIAAFVQSIRRVSELEKVVAETEARRALIKIEPIVARLKHLGGSVCGDGFVRALRVARPHDKAEDWDRAPCLNLDDVRWVEGLLWHIIRVDVPAYPTASELGFFLSLAHPYPNRPLQADFTRAAHKHSTPADLSADITSWLKACENGQRVHASALRRSFHEDIVRAARHAWRRHLRERDAMERRGKADADADDHHPTPRPLILSTAFDRSLELAFEAAEVPHVVVYPVRQRTRGRRALEDARDTKAPPRPPQSWAVLQYDESEGCYHAAQPLQDVVAPAPAEGAGTPGVSRDYFDPLPGTGVVIVKLRGSPLELNAAGSPPELLAREKDHIDWVREAGMTPPAFIRKHLAWRKEDALSRRKTGKAASTLGIWLAGVAMGDWSERFGIVLNCALAPSEAGVLSRTLVAEDLNVFDASVLESMDVTGCTDDIEHFAAALHDAVERMEVNA